MILLSRYSETWAEYLIMVDEQPTTQNKNGVIRPGDIDIGEIVLVCDNGFKADRKSVV